MKNKFGRIVVLSLLALVAGCNTVRGAATDASSAANTVDNNF